MKNNLISSIASWKSAALLGLVALIATVAFSGVLSTTKIADAQAGTTNPATTSISASPGETVTIYFTGSGTRFLIASDSVGTATFAVNGSTAVRCTDNSHLPPASTPNCDQDTDDDEIALRVTVSANSALGEIYVQQTTRSNGEVSVQHEATIVVAAADPPTAIQSPAPLASIPSAGAAGTGREISVNVVKASGAVVGGQSLNVQATVGSLSTDGSGNCAPNLTDHDGDSGTPDVPSLANGRTFCLISTATDADPNTAGNQPGPAKVYLFGSGTPGTATVKFSIPAHGLELTKSVVIHGAVAKITAEPLQSSIEIGGKTFIVVTITDASDNPLTGETAAVATNVLGLKKITAPQTPESVAAVKVETDASVNKERTAGTLTASIGDLPSCAEHAAVAADAGPPVVIAQAASTGTDAKGKCVIQVSAPQGPPLGSDPASATRGTHTVTVVATALSAKPDPKEVTVEISVGGAVDSITSDAPARVDPLSETAITVTVWDDASVPVGGVPIRIDKVEGAGLITSGATSLDTDPVTTGNQPTMTSNGRHKFTYLAPRGGTAVFRVVAGSGPAAKVDLIEIAIGAEAPAPTWSSDPVSGWNNITWQGESGASIADNIPAGVTAVYHWNAASQSWEAYFAGASDVPGGMDFSTLTNGASYWIASD